MRIASVQPCSSRRAKARAAFRLDQRVLVIGLGRIDIAVGRHDIVVAGQHHRHTRRLELAPHARSAARSRRACSRISARAAGCRSARTAMRHDAVHRRLDVAALAIVRIAGQLAAGHDRLRCRAPGSRRHSTISGRARPRRSPPCRSAAAGNSRPLLSAPAGRRRRASPTRSQASRFGKPLVDVVDVEGRDLHGAKITTRVLATLEAIRLRS